MSDFPRSPKHQEMRNTLAENIRIQRRERDGLRKEDATILGRVTKVFGIKDAGLLADKRQTLADTLLREGKNRLSPDDRRYRIAAFEQRRAQAQESSDVVGRPKNAQETAYEKDRLGELYESILTRWREVRSYRNVPKELSERFALVERRRFLRDAEYAPEAEFDLLSNFGFLRLDLWTINDERKQLLFTHSMYTLGEDGKTRGKGEVAMRNTFVLLQHLADCSGYVVHEVIVTNEKSRKLISDDPSVQRIAENREDFARRFFDDRQALRREEFLSSVGPCEVSVKVYEPCRDVTPVSLEDSSAVKGIMEMVHLSSVV